MSMRMYYTTMIRKIRGIGVAALCALFTASSMAQAQQTVQNPTATNRPSLSNAPNQGLNAPDPAKTGQQSRTQNRTTSTRPVTGRSGNRPFALDGSNDTAVRVGGRVNEQQLHVVTGAEAFEPLLDREIDYGPIPPAPDNVRLNLIGPMMALEVLDMLSEATQWNIVASPSLKDLELNFRLPDLTPVQAMGVLRLNDLAYQYDRESGLLYVTTKEEYMQRTHGKLVRSDFELRHADLENVEAGVAALLSARGRMVADPRTSTIIVFDIAENIEHMTRLVAQLDRERISQTYELLHVNGNMIFDSIEILLSEGGRLSYDPRSNTLIVLDRAQQQKQIGQTIKILDVPVNTKSWILNYANAELVAEHLLPVVPENMGTISYNEELRQVTVTTVPQRLLEVEQRIRAWDQERQQVQIEAYLVTISSAMARKIGFNWNVVQDRGEGIITASFGSLGSLVGDELGSVGFGSSFESDDGDVSAMLDILETNGDATILAHPRVLVLDGQEALFENTTEVPYATSSIQNNLNNLSSNNVVSTTRVDFISVGTVLRVMPRITQDGKILMDISSEDSSFVIRDIVSNDQITTVPEKTQNLAETQVLAEDGQTIIIGGLRTSHFNDTTSKVPILGDIPILGRLFRNTLDAHAHKELLIFITPTIIDGRTQPEAYRMAVLDQQLADTLSADRKSDLERAMDNFFHKDISVSIGQHGTIMADAKMTDLDALRESLHNDSNNGKTVIIRSHPRAEPGIADAVVELSMEAGLKFEIDRAPFPFVP
ncbi:MAG: secretin N-terminal domain-containing protein [Candidatus Hydrogenedentota bacterium]